jgi:uncharacterized membrane protein
MEKYIRKIVIGGVFSALIIVLGVSGLGFIPLPVVAITILHVPVIIAAILEGPVVGLCTGLLFGVFSLVQAGIAGAGWLDPVFLSHPWIALVPRALIGPSAWLVYTLVKNLFATKGSPTPAPRHIAAIILGAVTGSFVNTVLVLYGLGLVLPEEMSWPVMAAIISLNGTLEAAFSAAISLAVILPWKGIAGRGKAKLTK